MSDDHDRTRDDAARALPTARLKGRHGWTVLWLVPLFAVAVAAWLGYRQFVQTGYEISIRFENVAGLQPGKSQIKFRGVNVGRVRSVSLSEERRGATVSATLTEDYKDLAREGTRFWIVRPRLSGTHVRGLTTIASQNYITLQPGTGKGHPRQFVGAEQPPVPPDPAEPARGLKIRLQAPQLWGLDRGATVTYRGADAGWVLSSRIAEDGSSVLFDVLIKARFSPFVQPGSRFYRTSGIDLSAGIFKGVELEVGDLQSLIGGSVAFVTPSGGQSPVQDGTRFRVHAEAEEEWTQWMEEIEPAVTTASEGAGGGDAGDGAEN